MSAGTGRSQQSAYPTPGRHTALRVHRHGARAFPDPGTEDDRAGMAHALGSVVAIGAVVGALALGVRTAAPAPGPAAGGVPQRARPAGAYVLPIQGDPAPVRGFDAPEAPWAAGHRGVDLAAAVGQDVLAPGDGTVAFAGTVVDRGVITIAHPDGLRSSLEPVAWTVGTGAHVARGQVVGTLQSVAGHCSPTSCLHWGVRRGELYLDPVSLLAVAGPVILLPDP